jgi:hypothetical protein
MRAPALIAMLLLATPAAAQLPDMTPRSPIQAEQDRRIQGNSFEHSLRTSPQLYPYLPPPPASAVPSSPGFSPLTPPPPGLAPMTPSPLAQPIPPVTHLRERRPVKPVPPLPKEKPAVPEKSQSAPEEEKTTP